MTLKASGEVLANVVREDTRRRMGPLVPHPNVDSAVRRFWSLSEVWMVAGMVNG